MKADLGFTDGNGGNMVAQPPQTSMVFKQAVPAHHDEGIDIFS
jgi:hypothetical protein